MESGVALWGGFSSFFSIWQLCLLQISPFFMAFISGLFLVTVSQQDDPELSRWVLLPFIAYVAGFTVFYSLLIASGLSVSKLLLYNVSWLRLIAGFIIMLAGLYILLLDRLNFLNRHHNPVILSLISLFVGISFAFIYSPCITPTMSDIMGVASQRGTAIEGWYLAFIYGVGINIAFGMTAMAFILYLKSSGFAIRNGLLLKNICAIIVLIPALLAMAGLMRHYKAVIVGSVI
jgi:cytochrome c-type biogenesis protein